MKITRNTTVKQLTDALNTNFKAVQSADQTLAESITYAAKRMKEDAKSVKKADLVDLVKQVMSLLGDAFAEPGAKLTPAVAENSVKPTGNKLKPTGNKSQKSSEKAGEKSEKTTEESKAAPAKEQKPEQKPADKKPESKKAPEKPELATASMFPAELSTENSTYTLAPDVESLKDLLDKANAGDEFMFAFYWTQRQLKQGGYGGGSVAVPQKFDNDLDLASPIYISERGTIAYALSIFSEGLYHILPDSFEVIEGMRYCYGMEYQIYRLKK